jgi:methylenetetrahydrofolate dehydrogenase (NADP+)/methenyltetrahydrofolate cyclohydrolase
MAATTARILDGRAVAARVRAQVAERLRGLSAHQTPGLATILIGHDPASAVYVAAKHKACAEVGIRSLHHALPADASREAVLSLVDALNADPAVSGILCQLPLPEHLDAAEVTNRIAPDKDVDGLTTASAGRLALGLPGLRPCTPSGVMELVAEAGMELRGALAVVIGRSNLFGKPMGHLLLGADATVVACHSRTRNLPRLCREADVLIAAVGRPAMVKADWVRPGATVIDVGITRGDDGLIGDVDFDAVLGVAGAITPVPGGVGPMTIACLLRNTVIAAGA